MFIWADGLCLVFAFVAFEMRAFEIIRYKFGILAVYPLHQYQKYQFNCKNIAILFACVVYLIAEITFIIIRPHVSL